MKKALIIGIDGYPKAPLKGCVRDATAFGSIIEKNGDGSPNFSVELITDADGHTKKGVLKGKIINLFDGEVDTALLYFSGHGNVYEVGGYLITPDATENDEGVSMQEILTLANKSKARNRIIILDCCNSGAFGNPTTDETKTAIKEGVTILAACRREESAIELDGHGLFTSLLLDALSGGSADVLGRITPGSLYSYVDISLGPWNQRPIFKTNISSFTCIRQVTPKVPIEVLRKISQYFPAAEQEYELDPSYEDTDPSNKPENVAVFKDLQKLQSAGLVVPVDADFMYFAAINSKSCRLTATGQLYWQLSVDEKI